MNELVAGGIISGILAVAFVRAMVLVLMVLVSIGFAILAGLALATVAVVAAALLILTTRLRRAVVARPPTLFAART